MMTNEKLIAGLRHPDAYPHDVSDPVEVHQTHISIVFLAGEFAYKIKQPIKTDFLDYSTLELRKYCCHEVLAAGYSVIVDATFLKRADRQHFRNLAQQQGVSFAILDCRSDLQTLRQRVADRANGGDDASDANVQVLEHQIANDEPLSEDERDHVPVTPDIVQFAEHL